MDPKGFHRKLTAILSADAAGYSRLLQGDEGPTVKTLEAYKHGSLKQHLEAEGLAACMIELKGLPHGPNG